MNRTTPYPASERQIGFITRLVDEGRSLDEPIDFDRLTSAAASRLIDHLLAMRPDSPTPAEPVREGYYTHGEDVLVVVKTKDGQRTYAKRLAFTPGSDGVLRPSWGYSPGAVKALVGLEPLTTEAAARLGHLHGFCILCCRPLTDPESVSRGIGPVCATRLTA